MCAKMAFQHQAGTAMECLSIPITLHKEDSMAPDGRRVLKCGFKIGGGIDQDYKKSPQGYTDNGIYVTEVYDESPASKSGLRMHDKILQVRHNIGIEKIRYIYRQPSCTSVQRQKLVLTIWNGIVLLLYLEVSFQCIPVAS
ncbi:uncharacterized protein C45G9.7-like [Diaphorina citri]|uniref:Uncharacterized protein C45G9.7-like n=1 Tax=Diaphorina citri TaxID=121845 RepID=A0A3Q0IWS5_DIACI|nr:uncharacterized protein C45G9.7-like [Diaphorina citri]